jgi:hypothetical protein
MARARASLARFLAQALLLFPALPLMIVQHCLHLASKHTRVSAMRAEPHPFWHILQGRL